MKIEGQYDVQNAGQEWGKSKGKTKTKKMVRLPPAVARGNFVEAANARQQWINLAEGYFHQWRDTPFVQGTGYMYKVKDTRYKLQGTSYKVTRGTRTDLIPVIGATHAVTHATVQPRHGQVDIQTSGATVYLDGGA